MILVGENPYFCRICTGLLCSPNYHVAIKVTWPKHGGQQTTGVW